MSNKGLLGLLLGGVVFLLLLTGASLLLPKRGLAEDGRQVMGVSNLKQLSLGAMIYMADYDDRTPPVLNWNNNLYPYLKNNHVFGSGLKGAGVRDFAYNRNLAEIESNSVLEQERTPLFFRSFRIGTDLNGEKADLANDSDGSLISFLDSATKRQPTQKEIDSYNWTPKINKARKP